MFSLANHLSLWRLPQGVVGRVPWAEVCPEGCTAAGGARRGPLAVPGFMVSLQSRFVILKSVKENLGMQAKKKSQQYFSPAPRICEVLCFVFRCFRGYSCTVAFEDLSEFC